MPRFLLYVKLYPIGKKMLFLLKSDGASRMRNVSNARAKAKLRESEAKRMQCIITRKRASEEEGYRGLHIGCEVESEQNEVMLRRTTRALATTTYLQRSNVYISARFLFSIGQILLHICQFN